MSIGVLRVGVKPPAGVAARPRVSRKRVKTLLRVSVLLEEIERVLADLQDEPGRWGLDAAEELDLMRGLETAYFRLNHARPKPPRLPRMVEVE